MKSNFVSTCIVYIRYINIYKFIDIGLGDIDRRVYQVQRRKNQKSLCTNEGQAPKKNESENWER